MAPKALKRAVLFVAAACLVLAAGAAYAKDNLCGECHTAKEMASFGNTLGWDRSVFQEKNTLCPGLLELKKETYFTESRLLKYNEFLEKMEKQTRRYPVYMQEDLVKSGVKYADLASGGNPASISDFAGPNLKIKKGMNEIYVKYNKLRDNYKMEKIIGLGLIGTMVLTLLLSFGIKNTLKD